MPGVILAVIDHPEAAARTLAGAGRLAELVNSVRINVLAIRLPPMAAIVASEEVLTAAHEARIRADQGQRVAALKAIFDPWSATPAARGIVVEWSDVEGRVDAVVGEWGQRADFIVLRRVSGGENPRIDGALSLDV
jgi:hypothetical protein